MGSLLFMGNPYQHAPEVSIVRTDTCSTNVITVWATDSGTPPMSNSVSFLVTVPECVEASLGNAIVLAGQTSSVPVRLLSTTTLTNLSFTLVLALVLKRGGVADVR